MCGFSNVWVWICVGFVMCGNLTIVFLCLVICVLVFNVFNCFVFCFDYCFVYVYLFLFVSSVLI
jgi:hypothetical protein